MSTGPAQPAADPGVAATLGAIIGLPGAGFIFREGLNVRGLNTTVETMIETSR